MKMNNKILSLSFLLLSNYFEPSYTQCVEKLGECDEDCDCCGYDTDPGVRCELRRANLGRRCYISGHHGRPCADGNDCKSQYCSPGTGRCAIFPRPYIPSPNCPVTLLNSPLPVDGLHPQYPTECSGICSVYDTGSSNVAANAVDGDLATAYANERALTSGLLLYPDDNLPIRYLELCSAVDCPLCDPTAYKLEGYCSNDDAYSIIQEGPISFGSRNECLTFKIRPRKLMSHYKVTFTGQAALPPSCPLEKPADCSTCPNGLTPFVPVPKTDDISCNGLTVISDGPQLEYMGKQKVGDYTEIVYRMRNPGLARARNSYQFDYAVLQWSSDQCCFKCYNTYQDTPGVNEGVLSDEDEFMATCSCQSFEDLQMLLLEDDDENLCMTGIKLEDDGVSGSQDYFFKVNIYGDVVMTMQRYGIHYKARRGSAGVFYGSIMSPICGCQPSYEGECLAYPMQIAEVTLTGKCSQIVTGN